MRAEIIWDKGASVGTPTAWGSWKSTKNPTIRDIHEYIFIFSKETFLHEDKGRVSSITQVEFLENTKSIWRFPTESGKRLGHPVFHPGWSCELLGCAH